MCVLVLRWLFQFETFACRNFIFRCPTHKPHKSTHNSYIFIHDHENQSIYCIHTCINSPVVSLLLPVVSQRCDQRKRHAWRPDDAPLLQHRPHLRVPSGLPQGVRPETGSLVGAPSVFLCVIRCVEASDKMVIKTASNKESANLSVSPGRDALTLMSKGTTRGLVMWCWGTCVLLRWKCFASSLTNVISPAGQAECPVFNAVYMFVFP